MTFLRAAFVLLLLVLVPGCLVQTETFLTERDASEVDERLIGVWTVLGQDSEAGFLFVRAAEDGGYDVLMMDLLDDGETSHQVPKWSSAIAWPSRVGGLGYINLHMEEGKTILAYRVDDKGGTEIGFMDPETFKTAIRDGKLKGTVRNGIMGPEPTLTDTAENIAAFLRDNGGHDLFVFGDSEDKRQRMYFVRQRLDRRPPRQE